jgi:hypothetical protein
MAYFNRRKRFMIDWQAPDRPLIRYREKLNLNNWRLDDFSPRVPPPITPVHIPLLRGNTYNTINNCLNVANRTMARLGVDEYGPNHDPVLWWQALKPDRNRWTDDIRIVWNNRKLAVNLVANELENQLPGFQGLAKRFNYEPTYNILGRFDGGVTDIGTGRVRIGDPAFQSPSHLLHVMMHEGRHSWQSNVGGGYTHPSALAESDAYLFDLEHRRLSNMDRGRLSFTLGTFKRYCDINDRLAGGLPVEPKFTLSPDKGGWGVNQMMDPVRRADLELRFSFVEPFLRRELSGPNYSNMWSTFPRTFSYQPMTRPAGDPNTGTGFLRGLFP